MAETSCQYDLTGLARLKLFWALSRTPHGLLDMCTAALASLLWLGHFPSFKIIGLGLIVRTKESFNRETCGDLMIAKISMPCLSVIRWRGAS
jgi:hypothetical protein